MAWSPVPDKAAGDQFTEEMWDDYIKANADELNPFFTAWTTWTPTLTQSAAVTKTVTRATYIQVGKLVIASFHLDVTGTGTGGNPVTVSLPVTAAGSSLNIGGGSIFDATGPTTYSGQWFALTTTTVALIGDWSSNNLWGAIPNVALASTDSIRGTVIYEAA